MINYDCSTAFPTRTTCEGFGLGLVQHMRLHNPSLYTGSSIAVSRRRSRVVACSTPIKYINKTRPVPSSDNPPTWATMFQKCPISTAYFGSDQLKLVVISGNHGLPNPNARAPPALGCVGESPLAGRCGAR